MQLLESKVCIWETTVHIKAELDIFFFLPGNSIKPMNNLVPLTK